MLLLSLSYIKGILSYFFVVLACFLVGVCFLVRVFWSFCGLFFLDLFCLFGIDSYFWVVYYLFYLEIVFICVVAERSGC